MCAHAHKPPPHWLLGISLFLQIYICGRIGLIAHEVIGHGIPVLLLNGTIKQIEITYFSSGWLSFTPPTETLAYTFVIMGGILIELILGCLILLIHRKKECHPLFILLAMVFVIHALFYLVDGTYYGYGDGRLLHQHLGRSLNAACYVGLAGTSWCCYSLFKVYSSGLIPWMTAKRYDKICLGLMSPLLISIFIHAGLTYGESYLNQDPVGHAIFTNETERVFEVYRHQHKDQSIEEILETEEGTKKFSDMQKTKQDPFRFILIFSLILSAILGAFHAKNAKESSYDRFHLRSLTLISISLFLTIALLRNLPL